jgi:hypothetical protein
VTASSQSAIDSERLLQVAAQAAKTGKRDAARGIFRALSRDKPNDLRVWMGLAATAATADERRGALERALALDPRNPVIQRELAALGGSTALVAPTRAAQPRVDDADAQVTVQLASGETRTASLVTLLSPDDEAAYFPPATARPIGSRRVERSVSFGWLSGLLSIAALALLIWFAWPSLRPGTQSLPLIQATPALLVPTNGVTIVPVTTMASAVQATPVPATVLLPSALPTTAAPLVPTLVPTSGPLALGTVLEYDGWSATLLRPDYALALDGAIGDVQPQGRFVLALMAVRNGTALTRAIPGELFVLFDEQGRSYLPTPGMSSVYLDLFERGQRGDLALEDTFPANSGIVSVPLIFDVSPDAQGLVLTLAGDRDQGWALGASSPAGPDAAP